jgi:hypothetical protein
MSKNFETCHSCGRNYFPEEEKQHKINCSAMKYNNKNLEDDNIKEKNEISNEIESKKEKNFEDTNYAMKLQLQLYNEDTNNIKNSQLKGNNKNMIKNNNMEINNFNPFSSNMSEDSIYCWSLLQKDCEELSMQRLNND